MVTSKIFQILFQASNRGISLKNTPFNNFSKVQPIFTSSILIDSSQQGEQHINIQNSQYSILGEQLGKNTPNNNFSTVRPIITISIPIDSGREAEKCGTVKKVPNFTLGEQSWTF
jgi:hypothetical protein